jgi:hypothetical protein
MFTCNITLDNQTGATLTATNLFRMPPGLALRVSDLDGHKLAQMYAWPWEIWQFHIRPGSYTFSNLLYVGKYENVDTVGVKSTEV